MKSLLLILLLVPAKSFAQAPAIQWQTCLGGSGDESASAIRQTSDGGYIVVGTSESNNGEVSGNHGGEDYWIVKLDTTGAVQWQKSLGGSSFDEALSVQQTSDGGYIVAGGSYSNDSEVSGNHGYEDYWVVKLNDIGAIQWQKCLGGDTTDVATSIRQTSDGGYIIAGQSYSNDSEVSGNHGNFDYWAVKLTDSGAIQWQKSLGGSSYDGAYSIQQTSDGGYIVAGQSFSDDDELSGKPGGANDWIVKLNDTGAIQWQKSLGGSMAAAIRQTSDVGYIVAGYNEPNDSEVFGNHGGLDYGVLKINDTGAIQWQQSLGGSGGENATAISQTSDGGYIIAGTSDSRDGDVTGNHGGWDYWIVKLTSTGTIQWQESLGGSNNELAQSIQQTSDGGYIIAGQTNSNDGEVSGNHGGFDYWIVKLFAPVASGVPALGNTPPITIIPNPTTGYISVLGAGNVAIRIYNTMGQLIKEAGNTDNISIAEFPAGLYFVKVLNEYGALIKEDKIVKE